MNKKIIIYCDGACSGNQFSKNAGGWGAVLNFGDLTKEIYGGEKNTSNQRMEITACIKALEAIKKEEVKISIYSDSAYLVNCMNERWYESWLKNGWKNAKKKPVENQDLWMRLLELLKKHEVDFHKVTGHSGNKLNERADKLAHHCIENAGE
ncbi:MAG: ribonuclease HI [Ignavibacteriales bacterium]|nr:ribonuclease HI [Ignavibacteriales bacterium]